MDHDHHFPAEKLSEADRVEALNRLIGEFDLLKTRGDEELIHKRRQMLLSIWGDLVLGRQDPSQPAEPILEATPPHESESEPTEPQVDPVEDVAAHAHDDSEPPTFQDDVISPPPETIDAPRPHEEHQEHEAHESEAVSENQLLIEESEPPITVAQEVTEDQPIADTTAEIEVSEPDHDVAFVAVVQDAPAHDEPMAIEIDIKTDTESEPHEAVIAPLDEPSSSPMVIHSHTNEQNETFHIEIAKPSAHSTTDEILAKTFDVTPAAETPLLQIKDVAKGESSTTGYLHQTNSEYNEHHQSSMIRLRLLKTGVLHDLVLPQGTVISTTAADAEELITSGTAEKLLIQTDDDDD